MDMHPTQADETKTKSMLPPTITSEVDAWLNTSDDGGPCTYNGRSCLGFCQEDELTFMYYLDCCQEDELIFMMMGWNVHQPQTCGSYHRLVVPTTEVWQQTLPYSFPGLGGNAQGECYLG